MIRPIAAIFRLLQLGYYNPVRDQPRGQSLGLLIMRSRVRFATLPWELSLKGRIPAVTKVWVGW